MRINNITKVVNIKGLNVTGFKETNEEIFFHGKLFNHRKDCPSCHSTKIEVHDYRTQKIKDYPVREKKTFIAFKEKDLNVDVVVKSLKQILNSSLKKVKLPIG